MLLLRIKDIIIILLIITIFGAVLFGSLGNFLGVINGMVTGITDTVTQNEGYVYRGGYITVEVPDSSVGTTYYPSADSSGSGGSDSASSSYGHSTDNNAGYSGGSGQSSSGGSGQSSSGGSGQSSGGSSDGGSSSGDSNSSQDNKYEDFQNDYVTDMVDEEGNPIILSIISTSGGQMEPGIYQVYWSALGPINQTRIA